jgi:hypothetical protein
LCAGDAFGVDFDANHPKSGLNTREPIGQFECRVRRRAVTEIHNERVPHRTKTRVTRKPTVGAPKAVRARRSTGDSSDYHPTILAR